MAGNHTLSVFDPLTGGIKRLAGTTVEGLRDGSAIEALNRDAGVALLDAIGPAILLTHSQSGPLGWLIGSLADGPLWAIGPHGPIPVDPFKRQLAKRARAAYADLREGVRELQAVGKEVAKLRSKAPTPKVALRPSREASRSSKPRAASSGRRQGK